MEYFYIIGGCIIIILILFLIFRARYKKKCKEIFEEIVKTEKNKIQERVEHELGDLNLRLKSNKAVLEDLNEQIEEKYKFNTSLQKIREDELDRIIQKEREKRKLQLDIEIEEWAESAQEAAEYEFNYLQSLYASKLTERQAELSQINTELEEYRIKRDAINAEILRSRALNEQQDFYRIQIDENSKHDIDIINSIRPQIYKFETLNKLLYDNYVSKPAKEMVKRVLEGRNPSGIYKITNIETQEIYIGKSTSVADRWINHVKSACGLDGVADSQFQRALKKYGVDSFTWELLEETSKDKLTEREKYYIQFYDTTRYGYNMKVG